MDTGADVGRPTGDATTAVDAGRDDRRRRVLLFVGVAAAYALGSRLAFLWFAADGVNSSFFPAAGVTLGVLLRTRRRDWPFVLAAAGTAELLVDVFHDLGLGESVGYAVANMAEPLLGATLVVALVGGRPDLSRTKDLVGFLLGAVVLAPAVGGAIGATNYVVVAGGEEWVRFAGQWWIGDGLGVLVVGGIIVALGVPGTRRRRGVSLVEAVGLSGAAVVTTILAFALESFTLVYAPVTLLFLVALRVGTRGVAIAGAAMAFVAAQATAEGHSFWDTVDVTPQVGIVYLQLAMAVIIATALALAAAMAEQERSTLAFATAEASRHEADLARHRAELLRGMAEELGRVSSLGEISATLAARGLHWSPLDAAADAASDRVEVTAGRPGELGGAPAEDVAFLVDAAERMVRDAIQRVRLMQAERVARRRAELLERHAARLAAAATVHDVAATTVGELSAAGVEMSAVRIVRLGRVEVLATGGIEPGVLDRVGSLNVDDTPSADAMRRGAVVELAGASALDARHPGNVEVRRRLGMEALIIVPLRAADSRVLGALSVMSTSVDGITSETRQLVLGVAEQCGVALDRAALAEAEHRARLRSERFAAMAFDLAAAVTSIDAAAALIDHGVAALGADAGVVAVSADGADGWLHVETRTPGGDGDGPPPGELEAILGQVDARSGPVFLDSPDVLAAVASRAGVASGRHGGAAVVVPLLGSSGALQGAVALGFHSARRFSAEDRTLVVGLAAQAGQALERVALFEAERDLRARAELLERHAARLTAATTVHEVGEATVDALNALGAGVAACWLRTADSMELLAVRGVDDPARLDDLRTAEPSPVAAALRTGAFQEYRGLVADLGPTVRPGPDVLTVVVPLRYQSGHPVGALFLLADEHTWLHAGRRPLLLGLADQCGLALERVELHARAEAAAAANAVLARISESMDLATTAAGRAQRLVDELIASGASLAAVELAAPDGQAHPVARAAAGPLVDDADAGPVAMELHARGRVLGTLRLQGGEHLRGSPSLDELAARAAVAIDNALIYEHERDASHYLQLGLLAGALPAVEGVRLDAAYRPGTDALEVGGDWYDAFVLPSGRLGLVVGDVVGHNLEAATAMAQLRGAARALATVSGPAELLVRLDTFVATLPAAAMSTLVYVELDPADGAVRYACAGHPPPLVTTLDGTTRLLWDGRSPPLGASRAQPRTEAVGHLDPASRLVLYTDGLVERRGEALDVGLQRLVEASAAEPVGDDGFVDRLCDALLDRRAQNDDACVIAVERVDRSVFTVCFPAAAEELGPMRQRLRCWLGEMSVDAATERDIVLAVCEAATNAIEHGYGGRPDGDVTVAARMTDRGIEVVVRDHGSWREPRADGSRGRGLPIIAAVMDDSSVARHDGGTTLRMRRAIVETVPA